MTNGSARGDILYITPGCFDKGGISRYTRFQIRALRNAWGPDRVRALSICGPDQDSFETPIAVDFHGKHGPHPTIADRIGVAATALRIVLTRPISAVHVAHINLTPMGRALATLARAPLICNAYGLELWSGLTERRKRAFATADLIIADCHHAANYVVDSGLHAARPDVHWDCVDLDLLTLGQPAPAVLGRYGIPDRRETPVVLTLGRLAKEARHKGYERLIAAFPDLLKLHPSAKLVIAGRGNYATVLREQADAAGLGDACIFTGSIDEQDLPDVYRAATIFSLISEKGDGKGEGIPLTPLEAMASGAPIIVGDQDGSPEAVEGTGMGYVLSPDDRAGHVAAMAALLAEPHDVAEGRRARMRAIAEERFGFEPFAEKLAASYARLGLSPPN